MSQQAVEALIKEAVIISAEDPAYFCRFFLREWFPRPMPEVHLGLLALFTRKVSWLDKPEYHFAHPFLLEHFKYLSDPDDPSSPQISPSAGTVSLTLAGVVITRRMMPEPSSTPTWAL